MAAETEIVAVRSYRMHAHRCVADQDISEDNAYRLSWPLSLSRGGVTEQNPSGYHIEGHAMIQQCGGDCSFAVGGSRGCMRSCFNHLEKTGGCEQTFENGPFIKRKRWLLSDTVESGPRCP